MEQLEGRVVVVTGGASGIGLGIAQAFAAAGARLVLADVHDARLAAAERALCGATDVVTQRVDVRDAAQVEALAERAYAAFGAVHVLCNNAGVACNGLVWQHSLADWDWVFDTNVRGTVNGLRAFVPRMLAQGEPGHVVNTASMLGLASSPLTGVYGASKQTVLAITETLRLDLEIVGAPIGVSALCPGPVRTNVGEEPGRPPVDAAHTRGIVATVNAALRDVVANGMDPREVGERVVDAVRAGRFWILPDPSLLANVDARMAGLRSDVGG